MAKKAAETEKPIKKTEAVRQTLAEGVENPTDAVAHIKAKFGIDITTQQFSTYKSVLKAKGGSGKKPSRAPRTPKTSNGDRIGNGMVALQDLEAAKTLVAKVGAEQAKRLVGLFE